MLKLITLANQRVAQAFVDYMATKNITVRVEPMAGYVELWLEDASKITIVQAELQQFLQNPEDPHYLAASWQTGKVNTSIKYRTQFSLNTLTQQAGGLTIGITLICIAVYLWMQVAGLRSVMLLLGFPHNSQEYGELWRWLTPVVLHFSILHILFNLTWWWYLGGQIEQRISKGKLLEIFLLSALVSNFCQSIFSSANFGGLSGVVYALMGYAWLSGEQSPQRGVFLERPMMIFAFIWLIAGYTGLLGPIGNAAHLSGLLVGLALALKDSYLLKQKR